ncbi:MAG: tRNA 2-thiouridine(34) synthase MnmA [Flavobacteriales bacterium]|nr:tRNA 2-thiouridine(34) synthase MnmA [Flavobacteriales bacterium]MBT3962545.1 tRNA 2-thiouridine(34) synthase MnmA [Flavobacteriales bacterium]MBT4704644.1 tRNA 2-thiouridine(34) synthase MnmA [Flavobacteriales bacterium]MBT4931773.1 tRNA 2-thiouridine(34) synthase MnmA [Flavobacteriales bacterium]MBT5133739.1 tRNA 2-thiouridine(34) synthase MnmA [Flavobacteriales bacterium]
MSKKGKILVAMSGGIDSSVAAMLLHEQGYEVIGMTMKTWDYATSGGARKTTGCCSLDDINDARNLAVSRGFHHMILDIREEFGDFIIDNFVDEYLSGRTPNPCIMCNTHIKWDALLKRADMLGCDLIATGHYANKREENGRHIISKGLDQNKDQSYVLWGLSQEALARTIFPLGGFTKPEIRQMALDQGFPELAKKNESYEICFVPDNDYRGFLSRRVEGLTDLLDGGDFVDASGTVIGKHKGFPFYTIGQRKGLGKAFGEPMFVTKIDPKTNTVTLGREDELLGHSMYVRNPNFQKLTEVEDGREAVTKIRYNNKGAMSRLYNEPDGRIRVEFDHNVSAIAPGQSAVFYDGDDVIGGGFIARSEEIPMDFSKKIIAGEKV